MDYLEKNTHNADFRIRLGFVDNDCKSIDFETRDEKGHFDEKSKVLWKDQIDRQVLRNLTVLDKEAVKEMK